MAADNDSDYELMSRREIERLRRDNKKSGGSEKLGSIADSIERLSSSINKLISILEDAQEDIIEEYQESKPVEKLNQVMDQNETIAKAIISMHNTLRKGLNIEDEAPPPEQKPADPSMPPIAQMPQLPGVNPMVPPMQQMPPLQQPRQQSTRPARQPSPMNQQMPPIQQQPNPLWNQQQYQYGPAPMPSPYGPQQNLPDPGSLEGSTDLPPLDSSSDLPPLDNAPPPKKKKFLGFI